MPWLNGDGTEEGATKDSTMMGTMTVTYVCTDGQWKMDMSSFTGGGFSTGDGTGTGFNIGGGGNSGTKPVVEDPAPTEE